MKTTVISAAIHIAILALCMTSTGMVDIAPRHERPLMVIWDPPRATGNPMPNKKGSFDGPAAAPGTQRSTPFAQPDIDVPPMQPTDCCGPEWAPVSDTAWDGRGNHDNGGSRTSGVLSADVVDVPVTPYAGAPTPRYPEALRDAGIEGEVVVEFIVDTTGRADLESVRILSTPADAFVVSVRDALAATRYHPALVAGQRVRQRVRQGFVFSLTQH